MPFFQNLFKKIPNPKEIPLRNLFSLTLSAQVFTLPILIYNFGYFSLVSPLTNILIVPFLPYLMGLGFLFLISGLISPYFSLIFSWLVWLFLSYLLLVINFFSKIPQPFFKIHPFFIFLFYFLLALFISKLREKERLKFLEY